MLSSCNQLWIVDLIGGSSSPATCAVTKPEALQLTLCTSVTETTFEFRSQTKAWYLQLIRWDMQWLLLIRAVRGVEIQQLAIVFLQKLIKLRILLLQPGELIFVFRGLALPPARENSRSLFTADKRRSAKSLPMLQGRQGTAGH